jgi:hypothetical protein
MAHPKKWPTTILLRTQQHFSDNNMTRKKKNCCCVRSNGWGMSSTQSTLGWELQELILNALSTVKPWEPIKMDLQSLVWWAVSP